MDWEKKTIWITSLQWLSILLLSLTSRIFCEEQVPLQQPFVQCPCHLQESFQANNNVAAFQKLFMAKRIEQLAAVKNIQKLDDSKRKILLDQISAKLFQVLLVTNH